MNKLKWMIGCALLVGMGCHEATDNVETKPAVDPDAELTGKADGLSNHYTSLVGELPMNDIVFGQIDYPDYFHGYTVELEEGQTVQFTTWADAGGIVRLYGPGHENSRGALRFGRAAVRSHTERDGARHGAAFDLTVDEPGTYMIVYGPDYVWSSEYEISAKCIVGCDDVAKIHVADIVANPAGYEGKRVTVTGNVFAGPAICTEMACGPGNPCCNSCGAEQGLYDGRSWTSGEGVGLRMDGDLFSCGGNECTVSDNCTVDDGRYEVVGNVVVDGFQTLIDIERITAVRDECVGDSDCADGWCRLTDWDNNAPRECVAFVGEGDSCGGFAPPQYLNACSPELTCVYRPFVADAPGTCRNTATAAEVMADPAQYEGKRVSIEGYVNTGAARCTRMACTQADPCCNTCGAAQTLGDQQDSGLGSTGLPLVDENGVTYSCGGNECTYQDNCTTDETGRVRVLGRVALGQYGLIEFHVEEVQPLEHF